VNKALILFLLIGCVFPEATILSNSMIEDDVIISNALPDWGRVCIASDVRGGPDEMYAVRYSVLVGERVRIHDQSQPTGTWVSIGAAQWLPLKNLC
jgi:hypothetical protein